MTVLSQDIVDYLNQANISLGDWLAKHPVVRNFVTCPYISIRPTAIPRARRITAFDGIHGRFVDIYYRDGSHRYIINIADWHLTVANVEALNRALGGVKGSCHVERTYLVLYIPDGYALEVSGSTYSPELQLRELKIPTVDLA